MGPISDSRSNSVTFTPNQVRIVGSGLIGRAWACKFANAGWQVRMYDPDAATDCPGAGTAGSAAGVDGGRRGRGRGRL